MMHMQFINWESIVDIEMLHDKLHIQLYAEKHTDGLQYSKC